MTRFGIFKDYYTQHGDCCSDTWVIVYGTKAEAEIARAALEAGQDKSWFDPSDIDAAAILYVDQIDGLYADESKP